MKQTRFLPAYLGMIAAVFLAPVLLGAEFLPANLMGIVTDEGGLPIPEVEVVIGSPDGGSKTSYTDQTGHFGIDPIDPGEYDIRLQKAGFFRLGVPPDVVEKKSATLPFVHPCGTPYLNSTCSCPGKRRWTNHSR